ncbi:DUF4249 domain-containing protein [Hymenobacter chitinivorans]|nr:DUF4249 domain-containing protein [Hymenobacter chitinivorans]
MSGCIESFEPKEGSTTPPSLLVVDGFLNSQGVTTIKLTRSLGLKAKTAPAAEAKAKLFVEEENGLRYTLFETTAGTYNSARLSLNPAKRYRLHFTTANNRAYATDYTRAKITPAVDEVHWLVEGDRVVVQVSAHDETNQTQYYRWDAEETWEFTSAYRSKLEALPGGGLIPREVSIYRCWGTQPGGLIKTFTTTKLSQDVVADFPLLTLASSSVKLRYKYSVLVKQYAQTVEEFAYWEALRKNTENIGTLFDPLPSQLTGNVHCLTDPSEQVLGYIGAYSVQEQRLFISRDQLPASWKSDTGYETCAKPDTIPKAYVHVSFLTPDYLPLEDVDKGVTAQYAKCVDCRLRGTNIQPSFWK